jgi:hypothetical protein
MTRSARLRSSDGRLVWRRKRISLVCLHRALLLNLLDNPDTGRLDGCHEGELWKLSWLNFVDGRVTVIVRTPNFNFYAGVVTKALKVIRARRAAA